MPLPPFVLIHHPSHSPSIGAGSEGLNCGGREAHAVANATITIERNAFIIASCVSGCTTRFGLKYLARVLSGDSIAYQIYKRKVSVCISYKIFTSSRYLLE